ncbi:hypothetical protein GCM10007301_57410 [Azorhizobium oxalatiphilum]|uniref:Uncharacterized protein n=1 Tax=Azorhizobium oxalatiphilum TaxID=980631 RepID=A0A917CLE4_9HYPH|nr:hypothetical protein GCM10007301_57410 [Azorhizobium oxalatiphilum]
MALCALGMPSKWSCRLLPTSPSFIAERSAERYGEGLHPSKASLIPFRNEAADGNDEGSPIQPGAVCPARLNLTFAIGRVTCRNPAPSIPEL